MWDWGWGGAGAGAEGPHGALEALLEASQMGRQTLPRGESGASAWLKASEAKTAGPGGRAQEQKAGAGFPSPEGQRLPRKVVLCATDSNTPMQSHRQAGWRRLAGGTRLIHGHGVVNTQRKLRDKFRRRCAYIFIDNNFD